MSDMITEIPDQKARITAATNFERNHVVVAGAGTGKTGLLVERFLNLMLSQRVPVGNMVAITFTEKAAGEMKTRVVEGLEDILSATRPESPEKPGTHRESRRSLEWLLDSQQLSPSTLHERSILALDALERAYIGTIHGFCSDLLMRHPTTTGVPPQFNVDEGFGQDLLFEEVWADFLKTELGEKPRRPELWQEVLGRFLEHEIEEVAEKIARSPSACDHLASKGYRTLDVLEIFGDVARGFREEVRQAAREVTSRTKMPGLLETLDVLLDRFLTGGPEELRSVDMSILPFDLWERNPSGVFKARTDPGDPEREEEIRHTAREAHRFLKRMRIVHGKVLAQLLEALQPFAVAHRERILREGILSFSDLLLIARNLLRDHPEIRLAEAKRARAILVDEFQDTDPLQYEILFLLTTSERGVIADPYLVELEPGRLFIVGDPKQSIYRFRGADIAAYTKATQRILDGYEPGTLVTNFRSRPGILEPVNILFSGWIGPQSEADSHIEPPYHPIIPARGPSKTLSTELWSVVTNPDASAEDGRHAEAAHLAAKISGWIRKKRYPPRKIAMLFRALVDVPIYTRALREAGVSFVVDGGKAFVDRPEVVESLALLKALANPADPVATLAVLRSSLGGVTDLELMTFAAAGGAFRWTVRDSEAVQNAPRIDRAYRHLRRLDRERRTLPLDRWIQKTLTESEFTLLMASYFEGAQRVANVRKLAERASTLSRNRDFTLEEAILALEDDLNGERTEGESPLADEGIDAVRILTIHKAKGLEYDVLLLPDISRDRPGPRAATRVDLMRGRGEPYLAAWVASDRVLVENTAASLVDAEYLDHAEAENKRLLYVAMTRARERLILVNSSPKARTAWVKRIDEAWGYRRDPKDPTNPYSEHEARLANGSVRHRVLEGVPKTSAPRPETKSAIEPYRAFQEAITVASTDRPARFRSPSNDHRAEAAETVADDGAVSRRDPTLARAAGTAVHALLEHWDFKDPDDLRKQVDPVAVVTAREHRIPLAGLREEVETILNGFLASDLPRFLAGVEILGREVPVLFRDPDDATVHGYVDIVYRHDGRVHVADYKTDEITTAEHAKIYTDQLADYSFAIEHALNLPDPPVGEVLFIRSGDRIPVAGGETRTS